MSFKPLNILRFILIPISIAYGLIIRLRHWLYDINIFKSTNFQTPIICVGNISTGGTGKSPMVIYLARLFSHKYKVAILSRGYKRKTKGFLQYNKNVSVSELGDEPFMFTQQVPNAIVAVSEDRVHGVNQILKHNPIVDCVILDDAMQHRKIKATSYIALIDYNHPPFNDYYLPTGNLRDGKYRLNTADIIVVTKCHENLSIKESDMFVQKLNLVNDITVFFASIKYGTAKHIFNQHNVNLKSKKILLVTAIANNSDLIQYLKSTNNTVVSVSYSDHHHFSTSDVVSIATQFENENFEAIITTEKDAVKLVAFENLRSLPIYAVGIEPNFLFGKQAEFEENVLSIFI